MVKTKEQLISLRAHLEDNVTKLVDEEVHSERAGGADVRAVEGGGEAGGGSRVEGQEEKVEIASSHADARRRARPIHFGRGFASPPGGCCCENPTDL